MWRSTEVGAGENKMLEHTGHGSCRGHVGALIFILSYLEARDPERILP